MSILLHSNNGPAFTVEQELAIFVTKILYLDLVYESQFDKFLINLLGV